MATPYVGEIRMVGFSFAPVGWAFCNGAMLSINQNAVLFDLIGTTYGGDGVNTFQLPNLTSRVAIHQTFGYPIGQAGGLESVTLTANNVPQHTHPMLASSAAATSSTPSNNSVPAKSSSATEPIYSSSGSLTTMLPTNPNNAGGAQPHENIMPYVAINFIISMFGIFPSQS